MAGPNAFIAKVFRYRKMLGGGMRQSGVLAAPGSSNQMCFHCALTHPTTQAIIP